jgi:hypothetical protein
LQHRVPARQLDGRADEFRADVPLAQILFVHVAFSARL